jgi:thiosulfate/3-mercaptopyruvate sulfurtransferase
MAKILVSPEELAGHLDDPAWVVFDTRHELTDPEKGRRAYAAGHVPGAYFMHLDEDLSGKKTGKNGRHPLPDLAAFAARMNASGVTPRTQVVVYDDGGGSFAVRLWWMLRWLGHDRVALLDGGFPAWQKEARPVSVEIPAKRTGTFVPKPHLGWTVDAPFLEKFHGDAAVKLVDARAAERFAGLQEPIDPVAGHVPGAMNRFWKDNLTLEGRFKPADALRREFAMLLEGAAPSQSVHMCGSGVTACHNIFAMELAGLPGARLYPGSWSEWCSDPSRPISKSA